jgi:hypothetical protein
MERVKHSAVRALMWSAMKSLLHRRKWTKNKERKHEWYIAIPNLVLNYHFCKRYISLLCLLCVVDSELSF